MDTREPSDKTITLDAKDFGAPGQDIGPYRLLQKIGEGGMGEVWVAEQQKPLRRRVALKLIKPGMDTRGVIARFESERQALAMMDHPAIAKVFDAGETPQGRPYFVMEYVQGIPITTYCDRNRLTTQERLTLFEQVCEGVQHAHQKAVIHRDLKPSNILVAIQDGKPVPKIIDFGVAKATAQGLTERTMFTELGVLVGTPEYMSPEQAEMSGQNVDTRTDVYSLGTILYELLVGALPFDPRELRRAGFDEIRRKIRQEDPPKPSTRLSTMGEALATQAENRRTERPALIRQVRGDLDWITMKALEKDRTRRYGSPTEMAADIGRFLEHQPIVARPPSTAYRAGRFVRRHRLGVGVASALVIILVAFSVTTAIQTARIARERNRANREAQVTDRVSGFLTSIFKVSNPSEARGNALTARELLDKGAERIDKELQNEPEIQARMLFTMADVYRNLGLLGPAQDLITRSVELRRKVLGPENTDTLKAMNLQGVVLDLAGKSAEAEKVLTGALEIEKRTVGEDNETTLWTKNDLANAFDSLGRYEEAEKLYQDVFVRRGRLLGPDHMDTIGSQYNFAVAQFRLGRMAEAEKLLTDCLQRYERVAGADHPNTLYAMDLLSTVLVNLGRGEEARPLVQKIYEARLRILGPEHMDTLAAKLALGNAERRAKRFAEAEGLYRETLAAQQKVLGADHPDTIATATSLARILVDLGRLDEAEKLYREDLARMERVLGAGHPSTSFCLIGFGIIEARRGNYDKAAEWVKKAVARYAPMAGALNSEEDLAPLRSRPDILKLLEQR